MSNQDLAELQSIDEIYEHTSTWANIYPLWKKQFSDIIVVSLLDHPKYVVVRILALGRTKLIDVPAERVK